MARRLIARPELMAQLRRYANTDQVKVLVGVRRCGKSTLLTMFREQLEREGVEPRNIFAKRMDGFDVPLGYTADDLHRELEAAAARSDASKPWYVFLDEVQDIDGWERVVRRLQSRENTDVYITGSNSRLLSGELATHVTGRFVQVAVYPLSFSEYVGAARSNGEQGREMSADALFAQYMCYGGMPGLVSLREVDDRSAADVLGGMFESVIIRDVAQRYGIRDLAGLEKLSRYLLATSGNVFSTNNVVNALRSAGSKMSYAAVDNQIRALEQAFVLYAAQQEGVRGKALLRPQRKFYPVDHGWRNLMNNFAATDRGAQLEGIVYMELLRRGWSVTIGKTNEGEIDFVARRNAERMYVQVALSMVEASTRERELRSLQALTDAFPRMVLTLDRYSDGITDNGIHVVNVVDWLLRP